MQFKEMCLLSMVSQEIEALRELYEESADVLDKVGKDFDKLNQLLEKSSGEKCGCKVTKNNLTGGDTWLVGYLRHLADSFESGKYELKHYNASNEVRINGVIDGWVNHEMTGGKTLSLTWSRQE